MIRLKNIHLFVLVVLFVIVKSADSSAKPSDFLETHSDGSQTLHEIVPSEVSSSSQVGPIKPDQVLDLRIILPLRNESQLNDFLKDLYDPQSTQYQHFLSAAQFTQQYGPSSDDIAKVEQYLASQGLTITGKSPNGIVLNVSGPASKVEFAFGTHINHYKKADGTEFFAPDTDPLIAASVAGKIVGIAGLDNVARFQAHSHKPPAAADRSSLIGSGPGGFVAPQDIYKAYNLSPIAANGAGQNIALFELDGYLPSDISAYEAYFGINPAPPVQNILIDGFNGNPASSGGSAEDTIDIELAAAFAPGAHSILVYEAPNTSQGWIDEWDQILSDNNASQISCSWGLSELYSTTINFDSEIFAQLAATNKRTIFVASGDCGAVDTCRGKTLSVDEPSDQPYATGTGITRISLNSDGTYHSETASKYGGGGISRYFSIPSYQSGLISKNSGGSKTMRNVPDVAFTADPNTAYAFYVNGSWAGYWGSSLSAPIWAAYTARINQGRLGLSKPVIGFINPVLYSIAKTGSYTSDFHDVTTGNNGYYSAVSGYDDATGLGSFNGNALYSALLNS